jgi:hypothetical protein
MELSGVVAPKIWRQVRPLVTVTPLLSLTQQRVRRLRSDHDRASDRGVLLADTIGHCSPRDYA